MHVLPPNLDEPFGLDFLVYLPQLCYKVIYPCNPKLQLQRGVNNEPINQLSVEEKE